MKNHVTTGAGGAVIWCPVSGSGPAPCLIDHDDVPLVSAFPNIWRARWDDGSRTYYVVGLLKRKAVLIHRMIMDAPKILEVDHLDHDGLNNRRSNLRLVTRSENALNRRGARTGAGSEQRWVQKHTPTGKWMLLVPDGKGKRKYLGLYATIDAACAAREHWRTNGKTDFPRG